MKTLFIKILVLAAIIISTMSVGQNNVDTKGATAKLDGLGVGNGYVLVTLFDSPNVTINNSTDGCEETRFAVLDSDHSSFDTLYSFLLTAFVSGYEVTLYFSGCSTNYFGSKTVPSITYVTLY